KRGEQAVDEAVAELAGWIEAGRQRSEVGQSRVPGRYRRRELAPVRARIEPGQDGLQFGQCRPYRGVVVDPGEVEGHRVAPVRRTQPEVVTADRADLGDVQDRGDEVADGPDRRDRAGCGLAGQVELGLEFGAGARGELGA